MTTIQDGYVVEMDYTLTNNDGEVLDSSKGQSPLAYIQGKKNIIPGLEKEMAGKKVGDQFKVTIAPEEAYGVVSENMIQAVPKEQFGPEADKVEVGMQFQVENDHGDVLHVTAVEIRENDIVLDGNHPLAGVTLNFDVEVKTIREATEEELSHGHIHAPGTSCGH